MTQQPLSARAAGPLRGRLAVPGDKSISHRALILSSLAAGESHIAGLLQSDDILATAEALSRLGAVITHLPDGRVRVLGRGLGGLTPPQDALDFGNSGTGARLMMGVVAGQDIAARFIGDASLSTRPMGRVLEPLALMGARTEPEGRAHLPLTLHGSEMPVPITYQVPVPSAQVKSALLLAGLSSPGRTTITEARPTRDHTERMLAIYGAAITVTELESGGRRIELQGEAELNPQDITVPGDPSSAAFPAVAALITPGSDITLENVMINPDRNGLFVTLEEMGADIEYIPRESRAGEQIADLHLSFSHLHGVDVPAGRAPSMIDEYPVLAVAAAFAEGDSWLRGLSELRVKESDRLAAITAGLAANGVDFELHGDDLLVRGRRRAGIPGGGRVKTHMDHRIAMAFLVMGLASEKPVIVDDGAMIATSFPDFSGLMRRLGAAIDQEET